MKERRIILRVYNDLPNDIVGELVKTLPESGVNIYTTTSYGEIAVAKCDHRKSETFQIYKVER